MIGSLLVFVIGILAGAGLTRFLSQRATLNQSAQAARLARLRSKSARRRQERP